MRHFPSTMESATNYGKCKELFDKTFLDKLGVGAHIA
jgi:hypothetical protein